MERNALPHKKILYVCLNERAAGLCCAGNGSDRIHALLKAAVREKGLNNTIRVSRSGCMDRCRKGPNVLLFPDGVWYSGVTESDVDAILEETCQGIEHSD